MSFPNAEYPYGPAPFPPNFYVATPPRPAVLIRTLPTAYVPGYPAMPQPLVSPWPVTNPPTYYYVDPYGRVFANTEAQAQPQSTPPPPPPQPIPPVPMGFMTYHPFMVKNLFGQVNPQFYTPIRQQQQNQQRQQQEAMQEEPNSGLTIEDVTNVEGDTTEVGNAVPVKRTPKRSNKSKRKNKTTAPKNNGQVYRSEEGYLVEEPQETEDEQEHK